MEVILGYAIGILAIYLIAKVISVPVRILTKLIFNGIAGGIMLFIINFVGAPFGITIGINIISALIAGFFGIPGVILLILLNNF